jgi:hypothetical protein
MGVRRVGVHPGTGGPGQRGGHRAGVPGVPPSRHTRVVLRIPNRTGAILPRPGSRLGYPDDRRYQPTPRVRLVSGLALGRILTELWSLMSSYANPYARWPMLIEWKNAA